MNLIEAISASRKGLEAQSKQLWPAIAALLTLGVVMVVGTFALAHATGHRISDLTRDPADLTHSEVYLGLLSNIGVLVWTAAAAVCLFTAVTMRRLGDRQAGRFFLASGLVTLLVTLDDFFMFHERLLPDVLGVPQYLYPAAYGLMMLAYLGSFADSILRNDYLLLVLAFGLLGTSMGIDSVVHFSDKKAFVEDGLKFMGILFWAASFFRFAHVALVNRAGRTSSSVVDPQSVKTCARPH